jgi:hypothetical protein
VEERVERASLSPVGSGRSFDSGRGGRLVLLLLPRRQLLGHLFTVINVIPLVMKDGNGVTVVNTVRLDIFAYV